MVAVSCKHGKDKREEGREAAHPEWSYDATIYEINTRQFSPQGTFAAVEEQLPRLKDLGVDILWIMPVQPIGRENRKGELGSYYSIQDYTAVNPEYGTMEDFRRLVKKAHDLDMKVILDWVANHTAWDSDWVENETWYVRDSAGKLVSPYDWTDVVELDYANPEMRKAMTDAMIYWIREADVDGFRADMALELPVDYWEEAVPRLKAVKPDIFMLAEAEDTVVHAGTFDMSYAWKLHHLMNAVAQGKADAEDLRNYVFDDMERYPREAIRMIFTSNHDENSWNGTEFERMGPAAREFAVLTYLLPGMPLIYNGQEMGFDRRLEFSKKDSIDWRDRGDYTQFYRRMNALRKENPALWSGERGGEFVNIQNNLPKEVFSFVRKKGDNEVVGIFNLTGRPVSVTLQGDGLSGKYTELFADGRVELRSGEPYTLPAWGFRVLYR